MSQNQCSTTSPLYAVPYFLDGYGSLDTFYSIANGAIDNVQIVVGDKRKWLLYNGMGEPPLHSSNGNTDIINATTNVAGLYALQGIGFVIFCIMAFVAIFFTGCIRCCRRCTAKPYDSRPSKFEQLISLVIQFVIYLICFSFILTGIIIVGQSVTNFNTAISGGNQELAREMQQQSITVEADGRKMLWCSYNNTIITRLAGIPNETTIGTQQILDDWWRRSGLGKLNWGNQDISDSVLRDAQNSGTTAITALNTLSKNPKLQVADAQIEITDMIAQIQSSIALLQQIRDYIPTTEAETTRVLEKGNQTADRINYNIDNYNLQMLARLSSAQRSVKATTQSVADAGMKSSQWSQTLYITMYSKMNNAVTWGGYGSIKGTAVGLIAGPGALALLFIVLGMLTCLYYFIGIFIPIAKCGEHGRVGANVLRGGSYAMMWMSFSSIIVTVALLWYSQLYAGTCYNMYNPENRVQFYNTIHDEDLTTVDFWNSKRLTTFGSFLDLLESRATVWSALSDSRSSPLLSVSYFDNYVDVKGTYASVMSYLRSTDLTAGFSLLIATQFHKFTSQLNQTAVSFDYLRENNLFLPICYSLAPGPTFGVQSDLLDYSINLDLSSSNVNDLDAGFQLASSDTTSLTYSALNDDANNTYDGRIEPMVLAAVSNFLNLVQYNVYPSNPVYYDYANSGNLLCSAIRSPLNGTWAAAGMVALFWVPASICLWFTSNLLYRLHKRKPHHVYPEQPVSPQTVVETSMMMSTTVAPTPVVVVSTNHPIVTPVSVVESPPIPSAPAPAMYPVIPDDSLVIIEGL